MPTGSWNASGWHISQLGNALAALGAKAGIVDSGQTPASSQHLSPNEDPGTFIDWQAKGLGCEAGRIETVYKDLEYDLESAFPALLRVSPTTFIAVLKVRRRMLHVLTPTGHV